MGGVLVALGLLGAFVAFALSREARGGAQGARAVPSDMAQRLQTFLESNPPPEQIDAVAGELERAGMRDTAGQLRAIAEQRRAASTAAPAPATSPPSALPPPPLVPPAAPAASPSTSATPEPAPSPPPIERPIAPAPRAEPERPAPTDSLEAELERAGPTARASFTAALQSASASDLRTIAREVRRQGYARIADALEARAVELDAQRASGGTSPTASASPSSSPAAPAPEASEVPSPTPPTAAIDLALARRLAPQVAEDVRSRRYSYSRERLMEFQRAAGLVADGQYGGASRGALIYFGVRNAPPALFQPTRTVRYQPPQSAAA